MATELGVQWPRTAEGVVLEGVSYAYGDVRALADVSLRADPGEVVAIVGPSGCGKSTLLDLACGLLAPQGGWLERPRAVLMPQRDQLLPWLSALDNAALALRVAGQDKRSARVAAHALLGELGLGGFERARPADLSGGMRQRVAFARTLLAGAPLLCLDEPFAALDAITRADTQAWLAETLRRRPRTVLLVTHDVEEAALLGDRIVVLSPRPARVVATFAAGLPAGERQPTDPGVVALRAEILAALR